MKKVGKQIMKLSGKSLLMRLLLAAGTYAETVNSGEHCGSRITLGL
jgi:hypothetical protein